jgi:hypothetical protein
MAKSSLELPFRFALELMAVCTVVNSVLKSVPEIILAASESDKAFLPDQSTAIV